MLKPVFGTKDAPWAFAVDVTDCLTAFWAKACRADEKVFVKHQRGAPVLIVSTHVDDLKGAGGDEEVK